MNSRSETISPYPQFKPGSPAFWDPCSDPVPIVIGSLLGDCAQKIWNRVKEQAYYAQIAQAFPSPRLDAYFTLLIAMQVRPFISELVLSWKEGDPQKVWVPNYGIYGLLREIWPIEQVRLIHDQKRCAQHLQKADKSRKIQYFKDLYKEFKLRLKKCKAQDISFNKGMIAVRYSEGIDPNKRSDLDWFFKSGIDPCQVLFYFDELSNAYGKVFDQDLKDLKKLGIQTVFPFSSIPTTFLLHSLPAHLAQENIWRNNGGRLFKLKISRPANHLEKWLFQSAQDLARPVAYWMSFFREYNIKLLLNWQQAHLNPLIQGIAFDLLGPQAGLTVGKQRSDFGAPLKSYIGHHTKDIQFLWNQRAKAYLAPPYNYVKSTVITGFSYDLVYSRELDPVAQQHRAELLRQGAQFIIALFDSSHKQGNKTYFLSSDIEAFYRYFLEWMLADPRIGLVIKSKKPHILQTLPRLHPLLEQAKATGRCLQMTNIFGRLPSEASKIADLAVGYSISSAVIEAVLGGCKGIHYMKDYPKDQDYFQWGKDNLVFDDLDKMLAMIKNFVNDPASCPGLGDWSNFLDQLDPFRDGRAKKRMGRYLRWCLEGFEKGWDRNAVLSWANQKCIFSLTCIKE